MSVFVAGIKTRPNADSPYAWRVFVADDRDVPAWLAALGGDAVVEPVDGVLCECCEAGRLYSWGDAPVHRTEPPPAPVRGGAPMWHPHSRRKNP